MPDNQPSGPSQQSGNGQNQKLSWKDAPNSSKPGNASSAAATANTASSKLIGMFVAGLIIGLLIAWAWFDLRSNGLRSTSSTATSTSDLVVTGTGTQDSNGTGVNGNSTAGSSAATGQQMTNADISVPSSQPAGSSVTVSSIASDQPVWVVVYSHSDRSGQVMGAARFAARKSGTVELVHMTASGQTYYVGLVADTANHTYATKVNVPVVGSDGKQVMTSFVAQ